MFEVVLSAEADEQLRHLETEGSLRKRFKAVSKALRLLAANPRHPGLNTHEWHGDRCPHGDKLWEAYAENRTPGAFRLFFCYPPDHARTILVVAIVPHP